MVATAFAAARAWPSSRSTPCFAAFFSLPVALASLSDLASLGTYAIIVPNRIGTGLIIYSLARQDFRKHGATAPRSRSPFGKEHRRGFFYRAVRHLSSGLILALVGRPRGAVGCDRGSSPATPRATSIFWTLAMLLDNSLAKPPPHPNKGEDKGDSRI